MLQGNRGRFSTSSARRHPRDQASRAAPRVTPCPATTCMNATLHGGCIQSTTDCSRINLGIVLPCNEVYNFIKVRSRL